MQTEVTGHPQLRRVVVSNKNNQQCVTNEVIPMGVKSEKSLSDMVVQKSFLPISFVSLPVEEDGHITLKNQTSILNSDMLLEEQSPSTEKKWHHKAIRRNISKAKELTLLVGGLPTNLTNEQYTQYALQCTKEKSCIGPIFPTVGCFIITFSSGVAAYNAMKLLKQTTFKGKIPILQLLPYINTPPLKASKSFSPLLVFINCKSGGGQGSELYESMKKTLNPTQLFLMEHSGAIPGLISFRKLPRFRILVCGGDGTAGWVLSHIEVVENHLACKAPPVAILPVGTGNDLARVLGSGSSWSGDSMPHLLFQYEDFQPLMLDRWSLLFDSVPRPKHPDQVDEKKQTMLFSNAVSFTDQPHKKIRRNPINNANKGLTLEGTKQEFNDQNGNNPNVKPLVNRRANFTSSLTHGRKDLKAEENTDYDVEKVLSFLIKTVESNETNDLKNKELVSIYTRLHDTVDDRYFKNACQIKSHSHLIKSKTVEYPPHNKQHENDVKHFKHFNSEKVPSSLNNGDIEEESNCSVPVCSTFKAETIEKKITELPSGLKLMSMNNYMGIGIDAELSLAFHVARIENPEFCTSRLRNKAMYFKAGLKKMTTRSTSLQNLIELEVDGCKVTLPSIKGIIFLNIESWAGGANPWGQTRRFNPPSFGDGMLEVIGVGGVAHMSQIYSGLRNGIRIAQGEYFRITMKEEVAVQVDGEPWLQPPGKIIITVARQATVLKKQKKKKLKK